MNPAAGRILGARFIFPTPGYNRLARSQAESSGEFGLLSAYTRRVSGSKFNRGIIFQRIIIAINGYL